MFSNDKEESNSDTEWATDDFSSTSIFSSIATNELEDHVNNLFNDPSLDLKTRSLHSFTRQAVRDLSIDLLQILSRYSTSR